MAQTLDEKPVEPAAASQVADEKAAKVQAKADQDAAAQSKADQPAAAAVTVQPAVKAQPAAKAKPSVKAAKAAAPTGDGKLATASHKAKAPAKAAPAKPKA